MAFCLEYFDLAISIFSDGRPSPETRLALGETPHLGRSQKVTVEHSASTCRCPVEILDSSCVLDPWERVVTACLRTICLRACGRSTGSSATEMVNHYLQLDPTSGHVVFDTRLGLYVFDLAGPNELGRPAVAAKIFHEALTCADGYAAYDLVTHTSSQLIMTGAENHALTKIVDSSGLHRGTLPTDLLANLAVSLKISDALLAQSLDQDLRVNRAGVGVQAVSHG